MFTQEFFTKYKLTPEDLEAKFTKVQKSVNTPAGDSEAQQKAVSGISGATAKPTKTVMTYDQKVVALVNRINDRIKDGIQRNLIDSKIYWAIDKAYDVGFQQITPTLVESLLDRQMDSEKVLSALNEWGMGYLLTPAPCTCNASPCSCGSKEKKILNIPAFFRVFVPLMKAYVTIRWAKIFMDRNVTPLLKIDPFKSTALNRLRAEILTDRIQLMNTQLGYTHTMRQEIFQALLYSFALSFPKESWYTEEVEYINQGKSEKRIAKEGLRYNTPHPSRVFVDPAEAPSTFNTDSGCTFAGYWRISPWKSVENNSAYWNKDAVTYGTNWISQSPTYFQEIFPCSLRFPGTDNIGLKMEGAATGHRPTQRDEILDSYYTSSDSDKAVVLTEYFEKLNPSENGLGDYDGMVWFRFVVASNDTVVYCEPLPYCPVIYTGYDADNNRSKNVSLGMELIPFQDHVGNLLSQYVLSVKQNLDKVVFYNTDTVDDGAIKELKNLGEKRFRAPVYIPFSGKEQINFAGTGPQNAFLPVNFPNQNTQEIAQSISAIINILERIMALSSQELGQPATHEQTAQESVIIASNVTTRLGFSASFVDDASHARKVQLYNALMAYGSEEVYAQIETDHKIDNALLKKIGFTAEDDGKPDESGQILADEEDAVIVKGSKSGLILDGFAANREGENRINGPQLAAALANFVAAFSNSSSVLFQVLGPEQTIKLFNQMAATAGFPRDFRMKLTPEVKQMFEQQLQQAQQGQQSAPDIAGFQEQVAEAIRNSQASTIEEVTNAITPLRDALQQLQSSDEGQNKAIAQLLASLNNVTQLSPPLPGAINDQLPG